MPLSLRRSLALAALVAAIVACTPHGYAPGSAAVEVSVPVDASPAPSVSVIVEPDGTGVAQPLLTALQNARSAVHIEIYLLTNPAYLDVLEQLHASGIDVQVILNRTFPPDTGKAETNDASYAVLVAAGVPAVWAPTDTGFDSYMHAKTVIIDPGTPNAQAWIMTMNLDHAGPNENREYLVKDIDAVDIAEAEAIFEADAADTAIAARGPLVVAPSPANNAASALLTLIESATTSIDIEAEELTDAGLETTLFDALVAQAERGVGVAVVLEESSDAEQTEAVAALVAAGVHVVGYGYGAGLAMHAKAVVVDGARAFVGSENFSGGSLGYNRELGVLLDDPSSVGVIDSTILGDFSAGSPYAAR